MPDANLTQVLARRLAVVLLELTDEVVFGKAGSCRDDRQIDGLVMVPVDEAPRRLHQSGSAPCGKELGVEPANDLRVMIHR